MNRKVYKIKNKRANSACTLKLYLEHVVMVLLVRVRGYIENLICDLAGLWMVATRSLFFSAFNTVPRLPN